jgi:transcriptional regulator with XRE-family HTH domain
MTMIFDQLLADARRRKSLPAPAVRRYLRQNAGLTQDDVALVLGASREAVSRWERGLRTPRRDARTAYVELLERLAHETSEEVAG